MTILKHFLFLTIIFSFTACMNKEAVIENENVTESSDIHLDHFNIWVEHPAETKKQLTDIGFTAVPDSLCKIHHGQGTTGRYFYFLNTYLELIFVFDQEELEENVAKNIDLDFIERSNYKSNGASPFGVALQVADYSTNKIQFEKFKYHQEWMGKNNNIYTAMSSKTNLFEPSVFVVYPAIQTDRFETLEDLNQIPEEYALWREFYKHPNGAKKLTKIEITSMNVALNSETMKVVNGIENIEVKQGDEYLMQLYFDDQIQHKTHDLRPGLPLIIHL